MTSRVRSSNVKIETTIENCRSEGKWQRVIELAEELKIGSPVNYDCLSNFLIGEGKLESYLEENPPTECNFGKAKAGLQDAHYFIKMVVGENGRQAGIALDAHLLLAKLHFACGQYEECLDNFIKAELNSLSEKELTLRSLKILAESYAIKGLCLEILGSKGISKFKQAEREVEMLTSFEKASDLGLLYLQEQDSVELHTDSRLMGAILETALQRAPIVLIKAGKLLQAIERFRLMLNAVESKATQSLRLNLSRQLAEVLLRGVSGTVYTPPKNMSPSKNATPIKKLWKPRKYNNRNSFMPKSLPEETILLLLISEVLAVHDAVLSQSPEFVDVRSHAQRDVASVYDLLTLATVRWGQMSLLRESFEKALKFSFNEQHTWRQYALSLTSIGQYAHALNALRESLKLMPHDSSLSLMAARLCYEYLGKTQEGLNWALQALKCDSKAMKASRAQLYVGIGFIQINMTTNLKNKRENYQKLALEALEKAVQMDSNDHLSEYYLALQHALNNNISDALLHVRIALSLRAEHASSLHLFALLLTANRRPNEALLIIEDAVEEFPDDLNLLHAKAHFELHLQDAETALITVKKMLSIWRDLHEAQTNNMETEVERNSDTKSVFQMHSTQSDKDSSSIHAASLAASRVEQALSEAASSLSSFSSKPRPQAAWMIQLKIWLLLAEVYLLMDQPNEAMYCVQEASQIYPLFYQIMYMRGKIHIYLLQWIEAKQCFLNAVSANPYYTEALRALGETHHILGEPRLAEKMIKDAARLDPNCPKIWFSLGKVMETLGDYVASADCMATALQLEPVCPVIPFSNVSFTFE